MPDRRAVVLLSGGQDSTTCLFWALAQDDLDVVAALSFDYGQRHRVELTLAAERAAHVGLDHVVLPVEALRILAGGSLTNTLVANTRAGAPAPAGWHAEHKLPPSFVPGRNALFLSLAAAYAVPRDIDTIVAGVCQQDRAGYPDCRYEFVDAIAKALRVGLDAPGLTIIAPLLYATKAETWGLASDLGVLDEIVFNTHTCYEGNRTDLHSWGYGCGECGACVERARGYDEFMAATPA